MIHRDLCPGQVVFDCHVDPLITSGFIPKDHSVLSHLILLTPVGVVPPGLPDLVLPLVAFLPFASAV